MYASQPTLFQDALWDNWEIFYFIFACNGKQSEQRDMITVLKKKNWQYKTEKLNVVVVVFLQFFLYYSSEIIVNKLVK